VLDGPFENEGGAPAEPILIPDTADGERAGSKAGGEAEFLEDKSLSNDKAVSNDQANGRPSVDTPMGSTTVDDERHSDQADGDKPMDHTAVHDEIESGR